MGWVIPPLLVALIPVGALTSAAFDSSLRHRSRFGLRFAAFVVGAALPEFVMALAGATGIIEGDPVLPLLLGLAWGLTILVLAPLLLFYGSGSGRGPSDGDSGGPGPAGNPPAPPPPMGGLPLPDAEQSRMRLRGPGRLSRAPRVRRPAREPERRPVHLPRFGSG